MGAGTSYVHTFTSLGGQVLDFVFVFDLLGLGSGLDIVWLAGWLAGALIILA